MLLCTARPQAGTMRQVRPDPGFDGWPRLLQHRRAAQRHDHPRWWEHLLARDWAGPVRPPGI